MLVNLRLICKGYLHDVLIDKSVFTTCAEMYGGIKHGLFLELRNAYPLSHIPSKIRLYTYVRGVKHGKYYEYPSLTTLANILKGYYPTERVNYVAYGFFKNDKKHGLWQIIFGDGNYETSLYENDKLLQVKINDTRDGAEYKIVYNVI